MCTLQNILITQMKKLLIVANTPSDNTSLLAEATLRGASHSDIEQVTPILKEPLDATVEDVMSCDGIIVGTTENFGYMSGLIKDFFERIYYPCLEEKQGLPFAVYVRAGLDGTGTQIAVQKIIAGLRWKEACPLLLLKGEFQTDFEQQCEELGMLVAAGLDAGVL